MSTDHDWPSPMGTAHRCSVLTSVLLGALLAPAYSQTIDPAFSGTYTLTNLGSVTGVPTNYGGLTFKQGDSNTLLLGGGANQAGAAIYAVTLVRHPTTHHVTGFGAITQVSTAPKIDGGLIYAPNGALLFTAYNTNQIGQIKLGSSSPDKTGSAPVGSSVGTLQIVPAGYNGAGNFIIASYNASQYCVASLTPDGSGTYNIGSCSTTVTDLGGGGPEGIIYVPPGSPGFSDQIMLICEYSKNRVSAYPLDANGLPDFATSQDFITGLTGALGAAIDPVTGDFFFSTFGTANRIFKVEGFSVPPATAPGAPTGASATRGNGSATVSFTAPVSDGGAAITGYTVTSNPGGKTGTGASSPITVSGLTNGTAYTFTVTATNSVGTGPASDPSNSVTPATLPGAPTAAAATAGNASATISFTAPASDGGAAITGYTATSNPGNKTGTGGSSPITVSGLTNGTAYTFTVTATNSVGTGPASDPSNSITPVWVPGAPTGVSAAAGSGSASVTFTAPASDGGAAITGYTATSNPGGKTGTGASSPISVSGLTNGTAYTFTVTATNSVGTGPGSLASNSITPADLPGTPTAASALAGDASASVSFTAPASDGGATITGYTVTSSPGNKTGTGASSPITVSGLTNGTAYTFTVTATNSIGTGPASDPSNSVTPVGVPGAPTGLNASAGSGSATISFTAPSSNGGATITGYTVTSDPGGKTGTGASSPIGLSGLTNGTAYTFTVTATNSAGTGPASDASNRVTPAAYNATIAPDFAANYTLHDLGAVPDLPAPYAALSFRGTDPNTVWLGAAAGTASGAIYAAALTRDPVTLHATGFGSATLLSTAPYITGGLLFAENGALLFTDNANHIGEIIPGGTAPNKTVSTPAPLSSAGAVHIVPEGYNGAGNFLIADLAGGRYCASLLIADGLGTYEPGACSATSTDPGGSGPQGMAYVPPDSPAFSGRMVLVAEDVSRSEHLFQTHIHAYQLDSYGMPKFPGALEFLPGLAYGAGTAIDPLTGDLFFVARIGGTDRVLQVQGFPAVPGAPASVNATAGSGSASVSFNAPARNGGAAITSYTVTSNPGGKTGTGTSSPIAVTGLTNGTAYTFTVRATNGVGPGPASAPSNSVIPAAPIAPRTPTIEAPSAPAGVSATAGNASATVAFSAPIFDGGTPILLYTVISMPGGVTATGSGSPITVTGLTNGTAYTFTVRAINSVGTGPASNASNSVMPAGAPGAPGEVSAVAGDATSTISFTPPANNGGASITAYTATSHPDGVTAAGGASPIIVSGLHNGTVYTFTVTASNSAGIGPASAASNSVTPAGVPRVPTAVHAVAGSGSATISFAAPADDGGAEISAYTVTSHPGGIVGTGVTSPITVAALSSGTAYTFTVTAMNRVGTGPASAPSNIVTPGAALPGAPRNVAAAAGDALATITFDPPAGNGGGAILLYMVQSSPGGVTASGPGSPLTIAGLTNGTTYTFTVAAINSAGEGPASSPSNSITPRSGVPGTPQQVQAAAGDAHAVVSFVAPANAGSSAITGYTVTASPGGQTAAGPGSPITVTGLSNGTAYTFTVTATNDAGTGAASAASNRVTPAAALAIDSQSSFPLGLVGVEYPLQILTASGGTAPYHFAITSGSLPERLTFASPQFSGVPAVAGDFAFTISVTDAAGNSASAAKSLTINPAQARLLLSQSTVQFARIAGSQDAPAPGAVTVRSSVVEQLLHYSASVSPSVEWLEVTGGGTTPGSIAIALTPAAELLGAAETPYQTAIHVACLAPSPCAGIAESIQVSLAVTAPPPQLAATRSLLSFESIAPNPALLSQTLGLQNTGGGTLALESLTVADDWVSVSGIPAALAAGPAVPVTVTVNPAGLAAGLYRSTITIDSAAGSLSVPVSLRISNGLTMNLSPAATQFETPAGSPPGNPNASFVISTLGNTAALWTASTLPGAPWLRVDTPGGTASSAAPGKVSFSLVPELSAGLAAGTYYGAIRVESPDVTDSPLDFEVVLNVTPAGNPAKPDPSPAGLVFITTAGVTPESQEVRVFASAANPVAYQASAKADDQGTWLSVSPSIGTAAAGAPGLSRVGVNTTALAPGIYTGGVSYASASAAVRTINVTLVVTADHSTKASTRTAARTVSAGCVPSKLAPTQIGLVDDFEQAVGWPATISVLVVNDCGGPVADAEVSVSFSTGDWPLILAPLDGAPGVYTATWTPRFVSPQATITVSANASGLLAGSDEITGMVAAGTAPVLEPNGTVQAFHREIGGAVAPGTIVEIYGSRLAAGVAQAAGAPLDTTLAGASVLIGGIPAPLFYVGPGQINAQIPYELTSGKQYQIQVSASGAVSAPQLLQVAPASPAIAALESQMVIAQRHPGYTPVTDGAPAKPGDRLTIYLVGLGVPDRPVMTGRASPAGELAHPRIEPSLTLNGRLVPIDFAGLTPGMVGLYQINFQVPQGTPAGNLELIVTQTGSRSNVARLPVEP